MPSQFTSKTYKSVTVTQAYIDKTLAKLGVYIKGNCAILKVCCRHDIGAPPMPLTADNVSLTVIDC